MFDKSLQKLEFIEYPKLGFEELNKMGTTVLIATHSETLVAQLKRPRLNLRDGSLATTATIETAGGQHNHPPTDSDQGLV